jgi:hypothetical protein
LLLALDELANVAPLPRLAGIVSEGGGQGVLTHRRSPGNRRSHHLGDPAPPGRTRDDPRSEYSARCEGSLSRPLAQLGRTRSIDHERDRPRA